MLFCSFYIFMYNSLKKLILHLSIKTYFANEIFNKRNKKDELNADLAFFR